MKASRNLIKAKAPELKEGIEYKMLSYRGEGAEESTFHLNAQKNYVSLYVGNSSKIDPSGELLQGLDLGKGCIRFKKSVTVDATRIDEFIEEAMRRWRAGGDIGC